MKMVNSASIITIIDLFLSMMRDTAVSMIFFKVKACKGILFREYIDYSVVKNNFFTQKNLKIFFLMCHHRGNNQLINRIYYLIG